MLAAAQAIARPPSNGAAPRPRTLQIAFVLLALFTTLPLGLLWAYPAAAAVAVCAASVLSLAAFHALTVAGLAAELAAPVPAGPERLTAAGRVPRAAVPGAGAGRPPAASGARILAVLLAALGPAAAWAGAARRARSEAAEHSAARQVIAGSLLEHTARGERARVSRELHDVVAHHISMIAVQAETARLTTAGMPAAGAQRLSAIGDTARAALTEMRRLLGVLREDTRTGAAARQPQPGLLQLNELLDEARDASGSGIRLIVRGPMTALDPGVELAAYRIIQEALTNARRHAEGAAVDVELHYTAGCPAAARPRQRAGPAALLGLARRRHAAVRRPRAARHARARRRRRRRAGTGAANGGGFLVEATLPTVGRGGRVTAPPDPVIRIIVADDHEVVRTGFAALLDTQPDFAVAGTARDGAEAVRICRDLHPDVVLMDVRMPGTDGIEATRQLTGSGQDGPRILILTTFDLDEYVYDALCAGASGFLLKDVTAERLFDAVRVVAAGEALLAPTVTRRLIGEFARQRQGRGRAVHGRARRAHAPRDPGASPGRRGPVQPGDRGPAGGHRGDRQDARQPRARQAGPARPDPGGRHRLRVGPGGTALGWCGAALGLTLRPGRLGCG